MTSLSARLGVAVTLLAAITTVSAQPGPPQPPPPASPRPAVAGNSGEEIQDKLVLSDVDLGAALDSLESMTGKIILRPQGLDTMVMEEYVRGPIIGNGRAIAGRYLPRARRQHGYAALMSMAAGLGMRVTINALTDPDFMPVSGEPRRTTPAALQLT